jgi:hypothetical protein
MNYELVDAKYVKNFVVWYGSMTVVEGKPAVRACEDLKSYFPEERHRLPLRPRE